MKKDRGFPPSHVGIIPDGNRRWARENECSYLESYRGGMKTINEFVDHMFMQGVSALSVYLLSTDNLERQASELEAVFAAESYLVKELLPSTVKKFEARTSFAGQYELLRTDYANGISELCKKTSGYSDKRLYLLAAYNPFDELAEALSKTDGNTVGLQDLWVPEYLDLIIRTAGDHRISNFLPLQSGYAELIFSEKYLNDLTSEDMHSFLEEYAIRQRRFGH